MTPVDDSIPSVDDGETIAGSWTLVELTVDGELVDLPVDAPVTLTVGDGEVGGRAACNSYGGSLQTDGADFGTFMVGDLFQTEMACEQVIMDIERAYLDALGSIDSYELSTDLTLGAVGGKAEMRFEREEPVPDADLVGTAWVLDTVLTNDAAMNSPGMDAARLVFESDGSLSGTTGCRPLDGAWQSTDGAVEIVSLSAYDDPAAGICAPESQTLDAQVMAGAVPGASVAIDGQRLTVLAPGSTDGLSFRAEGPTGDATAGDASAGDGTTGTAAAEPGGGIDGPVMYWRQVDSHDAEDAAIQGTFVLEGDCLLVSADFGRFPVLWPFGTRWQPEPAAVVLPNGTMIEIGGDLAAGGGYHAPDALEAFTVSAEVAESADRCAEGEFSEVAVVQGF